MHGKTIPRPQSVPDETVRALEKALRPRVRGDVHFDRLHRALYSTDASIYEIVPVGVLHPQVADDVVAAVGACRGHGVPIVPHGAGTGLTGGAVGSGLQIDFSRYMNAVGDLDVAARTVRVQPGVVLDELNRELARSGLHFAPDVATSSRATIGGMIGNNSCGAHSAIYGRTIDHLIELKVVLADGSVVVWGGGLPRPATELQRHILVELERLRTEYRDEIEARFPRILRQTGGYCLDRLCKQEGPVAPMPILCGSEGTLGIIVEAVLNLEPLPTSRGILAVHFNTTGTVLEALGATPRILEHQPAAVELVDKLILNAAFANPGLQPYHRLIQGEPDAVLIVEFFGDSADAVVKRIERLEHDLRSAGLGYAYTRATAPQDQAGLWQIRKSGLGLLMSKPGDDQPYAFIEDTAVDPKHLRAYIERMGQILAAEGITDVGYYAHASVGELHVRAALNLKKQEDITRMVRVADAVSSLVLEYGGAMTGEHGDGIIRGCWTEKMYGPKLYAAFRQVKRAFDPEGLLNPGKIVDSWPMTENLRFGPQFETVQLKTTLDFSRHGGMAGLAGMCSGVGQCRQRLVGTMCPSYMATADEKHTTRARANALRIALSNRGLLEGLDDPALEEVMDLCLGCKACATECPTGTDLARLKYEWLSQKNLRHGVPRHARMVADAPRLAVWGSRCAPVSNWITHRRVFRWGMERWFGFDRRIPPPRYVHFTFRHWMRKHRRVAADLPPPTRGPVIYHVDTWTNYCTPDVGIAAVRLLEAAGYQILTPVLQCCGRPAIGKGLLTEVALSAQMNVETLAPHIDRDTPMVGTEPSCILTFVDEYPQLVRTDDARTLARNCYPIESFLAKLLREEPEALRFCKPSAPLLYHGHCHQKALVTTRDANELLRFVYGDQVKEIDSGCCGMAGAFGYEMGHFDVAKAVGEERLFQAVRERGDAQIAVSGFSCRHQIEHHCGVEARHLIEYLAELLE
ncbi:MAG: FAD-linked oxidase C-terminal domain-containing protein [Planctomycetota bacterium]